MSSIIHHHGSDQEFTQVANVAARDDRISHRARGVLLMLLSHRDGWRTSERQVANASAEGRSAVRSSLQELEDVGYLHREQTREDDGTLGESVWRVTDQPHKAPWCDYPTTVKRTTKNTKGEGCSSSAGAEGEQDQPDTRFPRRVDPDRHHAQRVVQWAMDQGQQRNLNDKIDTYRWALDLVRDNMGSSTLADRACEQIVAEYVEWARAEPLPESLSKHVKSLVRLEGPHVSLAIARKAAKMGAGLNPEYADDPQAFAKYMSAVADGWRAEGNQRTIAQIGAGL